MKGLAPEERRERRRRLPVKLCFPAKEIGLYKMIERFLRGDVNYSCKEIIAYM